MICARGEALGMGPSGITLTFGPVFDNLMGVRGPLAQLVRAADS